MTKPNPGGSSGATAAEAANNRSIARDQTYANFADTYGPFGESTWESQWRGPNGGEVVRFGSDGQYYVTPEFKAEWDSMTPEERHAAGMLDRYERERFGRNDVTEEWENQQTLNPEWQAFLDNQRHQASFEQNARANMLGYQMDFDPETGNALGTYSGDGTGGYFSNDLDYTQVGDWDRVNQTIGRDDLGQFGTTNPNLGAQDWRQFGTSDPTIGADDWRQHGYTDPTVGADDWREFGTTDQTINAGTYDERFGSQPSYRDEFGDHNQGGQDWSLIDYAPEAIRRQAEQQTLDFMNSQLDPQWQTREDELMQQLANQGLSYGDAAFTNALAGFNRQKNTAYEGARNQALADSRAEAMMLWDQEMGASEQKNKYLQQDWDNEFQARQSNIANYLAGRGQETQDYLAYQQAAFGQDLSSRQQQLDADWRYGQLAHQQDLQSRQQALDADLGFGREAFQQDYMGRQQQLDANRMYSQEAFNQDLQARQAAISNYLNYGNAEFNQGLSAQQLELMAMQQQEQLMQGRYNLLDPNATIGATAQALGG